MGPAVEQLTVVRGALRRPFSLRCAFCAQELCERRSNLPPVARLSYDEYLPGGLLPSNGGDSELELYSLSVYIQESWAKC